MKDEQEFTVKQIGYTARCNMAFQTDEHMQRHIFNNIFEDNLISECLELKLHRGKW